MADWWESKEAWQSMEEADPGFTEWAHKYKLEHGFYPGGGQDESLAQAISNREWSRGVASERGSGPTQQEWVSHYYRPDELGDTGQYWPAAVGIINKAFPETGAKTSNKPGFNDVAAQIQYDLMAPYWEQMAKFGAARAKFDTAAGEPATDYDDLVTSMATERGIDPALARAILYWESGGNPDLRGADGEVGLMQVIPSDMADVYSWASSRPSVADMSTPEAQIKAGLDVLEDALASANGDVEEALSYYNSGGPLANAPDSTRNAYIPGVMSLYQQMRGTKPTRSRGSGGAAPQASFHEPNPDYAYMMREDGGIPVPEPEPPETFKPGPEAYEALTRAGLYKPTAEAQAALAATGAKPDTRRQVTSQDPTQQTLGAIINALISAYPQAAGEEAMRRWQAATDVVSRGVDRVTQALGRQPQPAPDDAPMGEPGVFETEYRNAIADLAMPQKPGPVSFTDALNAMNQAPDTARRDVPGVVWERLYLNPNATEAQRQAALRNLGLRNESDFQLYMIGQNRPEVQAAKQLALDMWERDESDVDLPTQNLFVTPEGAEGATKVLSAVAAIVPDMVIRPSAFAVAEIGKAITSSIANTPKIGEWVQDLAASAAGALPQVTMPTLGDAGRAAVTALAQGGYLPEQILGFLSLAQMNKEQLQRWSDLEAGRQAVLDLRAAGMEDTPEYRLALYRFQQMEAQEKARYEAALGVDVSGVPGIQQIETILGGFLTPEQKAAELARLQENPSATLRYLNDPDLAELVETISDPTKRAAAWESARAGYWTNPGLVSITYMQLLGVPTDDWEAVIQKAATYQNLGNEMLGQIPFDFYNLRVFEAPGRALYNRFMNRGKNYWIADVSKTADDALDDIVRANQKRGLIPTILPGATVDARRAEMLNKLSVSMQMATSGAETADDYVRLLAGYTADPVGFLNKRGLPHSQGMLEGAAILREYAGFGSKEIRVQRYADDLAEAIQEYKTAKAAGTASKEMTERIKQLRRRLNTAKKAEPAESLAKRLDKIADEGKRIHGYAGADLREYVQEEAFAKLQKTIDGLIPESSANLLEKGLSPIMKSPYYRGFMNVLVTGHMGLNPGWFFRNMTTDNMIMMIDGYNPFRSKKAVQKFIDDLGIEPRSVSKAAPIGRQAGAGGTDIGMMKPQSELERYNGEKIFTESAGNTIRPLNLQGVDSVFLKNAPKGTFTPNQEAYIRRIGEQALSERKFRDDFGRLFDGTATVDDVLGPPTWKQAYGLNVEDEVKKLVEAQDDAARAAIRKAQDETLDKYVEKHPLTDHPRVDSEEAARVAQRQRVAPDTVDPAEMPAGQADAIDRRLAEMAADDLDETIDVSKQEMIWRSRVHAPRFAPYTEAKGKVLAAIRSFTDEEDLAKAAGAHEVWGEMVVAQKAAKERFAHAAELFEEANEAFALAGKRTGKVKGLFRHADNAWAKAARQSTEELSEAYNKFTDFYNGATGKKWVGPVAPKGPAPSTSPAAKAVPAPKVEAPAVETPPQVARAEEAAVPEAAKVEATPQAVTPEAPAATDVPPTSGSDFARVYGPDARLKEPWQMTHQEWNDFYDKLQIGRNKMGAPNHYFYGVEDAQVEAAMAWNRRFDDLTSGSKTSEWWDQSKIDDYNMHKQMVREAIRRGYPVPDNVLKEYPDLAKRGGVAGAIADETDVSGLSKDELRQEASRVSEQLRREMEEAYPEYRAAMGKVSAEELNTLRYADAEARHFAWKDAVASGDASGLAKWPDLVEEHRKFLAVVEAQARANNQDALLEALLKKLTGDETGSLDLTSIRGQVAHTKRFLDDVAERLKGRPGLSKVEPLSDAAKKHLRENYKEWVRVLNKNRLVAANYGEHARHFAMHNYDGKMSADQLASLTLMYPFWSTRTYAKLPLRAMMHPGLLAKYLRYKRWLEEENKDLPEWYRDKIVIDNTKIPWLPEELIIDLEASLNPYNTLNREPFDRPRQTEGGDVSSTLGKYMQFAEKYGFNAHFGIIAAYAASKALEGDPEAAKAAMGYPAPALRALRDITAWMGLNNGWGIELVPWHWRQGLQTPFTGGDYYTLRRIAAQIGKLTMSGQISPLDGREAAIAYARGETDNPIIRKALEAESEQRGAYNILGFFTSFSAKGRTGYDKELDQFYADMDQLYASAANMTDDEFKQALSEFYNDPAHYHYRVADIARSDVDEAETKYIRDIWWNSIPPGQRDVVIAKYGDEETGAILERLLDKDGPGIGALSEEERIRVTMFMAALSSKYPPPNQEMFEEWQAVKDAYNKFEAATAEKFGNPDAISATDALNMMRQGQGQPAQSEFDRIMEAYWAADPETKKAMRKQYPVIDEYFDWKTDYMENDPLLMWYYGEVPRKQATDNLWNLYNAFTDAGMAQTKVDLAEDLDAMGADMGIPGCELDEEGEGCFTRFFRNQDTRDYEKIPNELLLAWTLYVASESAKRGVDPNVYRTQEGEAAGTQALAPEPSGGDPAIVTSPWQMGESEPARTGLPGTEYERTYGAESPSGPGLQVPTDVPGKAVVSASPDGLGTSVGGLDVAADAPGPSAGGSGGKPVVAGDGSAELAPTAPATGEKSFWDFDFTEEQFERAAPEMDALRSERNRLYKMCENGVEQACNQLKDDRFNVFSTPEWLFYYEQIAPGWRLQDSGFYDDPLIKQWLDPTTREGVTAESALKRMQELKNALPGLSYGDPKEYSQARDEQEQWKETSQNLMPGTMAYRQAQAKYAEEHPIWAKYYLRPQTAASLAEYAARGWTYAPRSGGGGSSDGGGTSGGSGYRYTGPWFSPDTFRGANTSRRPAMQDSDLWQRVVLAALSRTKQ